MEVKNTNANLTKPILIGEDKEYQQGINHNKHNYREESIYGHHPRRMTGYPSYGYINYYEKGVNGQIDEGIFQGENGDCWLLSGITSLSYTADGAKIIKDSISKNADGSYNVYFQGINKSYTVSQEELANANKSTFLTSIGVEESEYSTGDDDALLVELAMEKLIKEDKVPIETVDGLSGGSAYYLYQLFTDNAVGYTNGQNEQTMCNLLNYYAVFQDSSSATLGVLDGFAGLEDNHAYAVKSYENGVMTIVNPWDTTEDIKITNNDLLQNMGSYDLSIVDNELEEAQTWYQENYA